MVKCKNVGLKWKTDKTINVCNFFNNATAQCIWYSGYHIRTKPLVEVFKHGFDHLASISQYFFKFYKPQKIQYTVDFINKLM